MQFLKLTSLVALVLLSCTAAAQTTGKTRAEVKAETRAAIRAGDVPAPGDSGKTLREVSPEKYDAGLRAKRAKRSKMPKSIDRSSPSQ